MQNLLFNNLLSDIIFEVENEEIYAHRVILATRCEYFKTLCTSIYAILFINIYIKLKA
jgi:hypothetical protein